MNVLTALVITGSQFLHYLLYIVLVGLLFGVILWGLKAIPLPEPFAKIAKALCVIAVVVILIGFIMDIAGHPLIAW